MKKKFFNFFHIFFLVVPQNGNVRFQSDFSTSSKNEHNFLKHIHFQGTMQDSQKIKAPRDQMKVSLFFLISAWPFLVCLDKKCNTVQAWILQDSSLGKHSNYIVLLLHLFVQHTIQCGIIGGGMILRKAVFFRSSKKRLNFQKKNL